MLIDFPASSLGGRSSASHANKAQIAPGPGVFASFLGVVSGGRLPSETQPESAAEIEPPASEPEKSDGSPQVSDGASGDAPALSSDERGIRLSEPESEHIDHNDDLPAFASQAAKSASQGQGSVYQRADVFMDGKALFADSENPRKRAMSLSGAGSTGSQPSEKNLPPQTGPGRQETSFGQTAAASGLATHSQMGDAAENALAPRGATEPLVEKVVVIARAGQSGPDSQGQSAAARQPLSALPLAAQAASPITGAVAPSGGLSHPWSAQAAWSESAMPALVKTVAQPGETRMQGMPGTDLPKATGVAEMRSAPRSADVMTTIHNAAPLAGFLQERSQWSAGAMSNSRPVISSVEGLPAAPALHGASATDPHRNLLAAGSDNTTPMQTSIRSEASLAQMASMLDLDIAAQGRRLDGDGGSLRGDGWGAASGATSHALYPAAADAESAARSQSALAREAAQQIGAQILNLGKGRFELTLAPAELGKVEMWLQETDNRLTLTVNAERAETMDLIRRHIGLLEQELRQLGFGGLSLNMGTGGTAHSHENRHSKPSLIDAVPTTSEETRPSPQPPLVGDHLDLRL